MPLALLPSPTGINAGATSTMIVPTGPTYERFIIEMKAGIGAATPALVPVANWDLYISEIRLKVNGKVIQSGPPSAFLSIFARFNAQPIRDGHLCLYQGMPWARGTGGEDDMVLGTLGLDNVTLEMDLVAGIFVETLNVWVWESAGQEFGRYLSIDRYERSVSGAGKFEIPDINRDLYNMIGFHIDTADIDKVEVRADRTDYHESNKVVRNLNQEMYGKVAQAGWTHVDFMHGNRIGNIMKMDWQNDFRLKLDFTAAAANFTIYAIGQKVFL